MSDDELVKKMAIAIAGLAWVGAPTHQRAIWLSYARAALAAAAPVIRERCSDAAASMGWRYAGPVLTPTEAATLRAERDAAMEKCARMTEHAQQRDKRIRGQRAMLRMLDKFSEPKLWSDKACITRQHYLTCFSRRIGKFRSEFVALRAENARLREALIRIHDMPNSDSTVSERSRAMKAIARAALNPEPAP